MGLVGLSFCLDFRAARGLWFVGVNCVAVLGLVLVVFGCILVDCFPSFDYMLCICFALCIAAICCVITLLFTWACGCVGWVCWCYNDVYVDDLWF